MECKASSLRIGGERGHVHSNVHDHAHDIHDSQQLQSWIPKLFA